MELRRVALVATEILGLESEGLGEEIRRLYERLDSSPVFRRAFVANPARDRGDASQGVGHVDPGNGEEEQPIPVRSFEYPAFIEPASTKADRRASG